MDPTRDSPPAETQYEAVLAMVRKLDSEMSEIRTVCKRLLYDNRNRDRAMYDLTGLVKMSLPQPDAFPATSTPYQPSTMPYHTSPPSSIPYQHTSTPYQPMRDHGGCDMSTPRQPQTLPTCLEIPDTCTPLCQAPQENRQGYQPVALIQQFNNKSLNWPSWFRHFRTVADVHGWDDNQRAIQLVSYLDETAMNVAHELGDDELYNYDILVKLLGDRFDPASRVSASRSRFHGRLRRHHEDADSFADAITDLCRVGYPQSSPELRQELISEQFMRGQSDPELKKYLWVVIRTQKDRKLQTLIEVCTDFASLGTSPNIHRPAEQVLLLRRIASRRTCLLWQIDLRGPASVTPILRCHLRYSRCSL